MKKAKRIAALIGVILMASLVLLTVISAFVATEYSYGLFMASIFSTIVIPIMIHMYIMIYRMVHKKKQAEEEQIDKESEK